MARWVPDEQTNFARRLRREMTAAEAMVWRALRGGRLAGLKSRRQVPFGRCATDFLCHQAKLIVEVDGPSHDDPDQMLRDGKRDTWLKSQGFRVLRFSNDLALVGTEVLTRQIEAALKVGSVF